MFLTKEVTAYTIAKAMPVTQSTTQMTTITAAITTYTKYIVRKAGGH